MHVVQNASFSQRLEFKSIFSTLKYRLLESSPVDVGEWQSIQGSVMMRELLHVVFEYDMPATQQDVAEDTGARLPWAEDHFLERVGGEPLNPAPSEAWWPFASKKEGTNVAHKSEAKPHIDAKDWAYLAAFLDGEGSLRIKPSGRGGKFLQPRISVSQKDITATGSRGGDLIRELHELFYGVGRLYEVNRDKLTPPSGNVYTNSLHIRWEIGNKEQVRWVLEGILPYIRLKKQIAQEMLNQIESTDSSIQSHSKAWHPDTGPAAFSHTYPERFWPKVAGKTSSPHQGIRFPYGDLNDVVNRLSKSPNTRQAYLPIWHPEDTSEGDNKRLPCTLGYHFIIRDGKLDISYFMRSTDLVRHFQDDVYMAVRLAQWVAEKVTYANVHEGSPDELRVGNLIFHTANLHIFEQDVDLLKHWAANGKTWF